MTLDRWLLYIHILGAVSWMGAGLTFMLLGLRARDATSKQQLIAQMEWLGARVGGLAVIVMAATGVWMVARGVAWDFGQAWVLLSIVLLVVLFLVGIGFHMPQYRRIRTAIAEYGPEAPQTNKLVWRSLAATRVEVALLAVVVLLMVFKPGV